MGIRQWVQWETVNGPTVQHHGWTVTPQAQAITLHVPVPFLQSAFGFVWNRPVAVVVEQDEKVTRIPIYNLNRLLIILILGLVTPILLAFWFVGKITGLLK